MTLPRFTFTDRARPFLELGVGDSRVAGGAAIWDVSLWDVATSVWGGVEPNWRDVTCEAFQVQITAGRDRSADRFSVATMSVTAHNVSGWGDLHPPDPGAVNRLMLRPGRAIRFGVDHDTAGRTVLFRGFVDVVEPTYEPDSDVVTLSCIDALGEIGRQHLSDVVASGAGEYVHTRIGRILDAAQWPPSKRTLEGSNIALLPVEIDGQVADLLSQTSDSAGGAVFGDVEGSIVYRAMDWQVFQTDRPPTFTIGNVGPDDVCPIRWVRPFDRGDMSNIVIMGNVRDPVPDRVMVSAPASFGLYGIETLERTDLATDAVTVLTQIADRFLVTRGADTIPRIRSVSVDARTADNAVDLLCDVTPYLPSRYRCRLELERGLIFDEEHLCTGVSHAIDPDTWVTDINLDLAAVYAAPGARWEPALPPNTGLGRWNRCVWN